MRRRTLLATAAAALAVGLPGCGIPDETEVRDIGPGPDPGMVTGGGTGVGPPARNAATTKELFVTNFLLAAAGDPDKAVERVRRYVTETTRDKVKAGEDNVVNVVRLSGAPVFVDEGKGSWEVTLKVDQVGVLHPNGWVGKAERNQPEIKFKIGGIDGTDTWYVTAPPAELLLSADALDTYYTPRTIYFWSIDRQTLVPDARYMPNDLDNGRQPTKIVDWLVAGPSPWVKPAVSELAAGAGRKQNVPFPKDRLEVAFNADVAGETDTVPGVDVVLQLGQQLLWSLRTYVKSDLKLQIEGVGDRVFTMDQAFYKAHAAYRSLGQPGEADKLPERFALFQGRIHRLKGSTEGGTQSLPQLLLADGVNANVASAALAREDAKEGMRTAAALVTQRGGQYTLRTGAAIGDSAQAFTETKPYASMPRAVWLKAPMDAGLVVADGKLYWFTPGDKDLSAVANVPPGTVTDVSAAPDGRRIVILVNGRVWALGISRDSGGIEAKGAAQLVPTTSRRVSAVDWSEDNKIVIAGRAPNGKPAVWEVSLDGAIEAQQFSDTGGEVRRLVAYPDGPLIARPNKATAMMYSTAEAAFDFGVSIKAGDVMGATVEVNPAHVTEPFFLLD